jgi:hypothetical protein
VVNAISEQIGCVQKAAIIFARGRARNGPLKSPRDWMAGGLAGLSRNQKELDLRELFAARWREFAPFGSKFADRERGRLQSR